MGVLPLVFSSGAGAEMRHAMGVAVFSGMLGVTFFGLVLTPVFYVVILAHRRAPAALRARRPPSSRPRRRSMRRNLLILATLALPGCSSAPGYRPSAVAVPAAFRETGAGHHHGGASRRRRRPTPAPRWFRSSPSERRPGPWTSADLLARARGHDARSPDDRGAAAPIWTSHAALARVRGARAARTETALDLAPTVVAVGGYTRQRLSIGHVPDRRRGAVPRPEHLGRRVRRVVGARPVRPGAAQRAGAGRAGRRGRRGPARCAGGPHRGARADLLRAARGAGTAGRGPA